MATNSFAPGLAQELAARQGIELSPMVIQILKDLGQWVEPTAPPTGANPFTPAAAATPATAAPPTPAPQSTWANPFGAGGIGQIFPSDEGVSEFENLFNMDTSRGLQAISPFLGKYRNPLLRNPGAVKGAYEAFELQNPVGEGEGGAANFFAQFNPDQFVGRLNPFERGVNPSQFASRQRRIFR